ncbi:MAG: NADH:ubiquinone oxidoreductase [Bacteroidota bacterium]
MLIDEINIFLHHGYQAIPDIRKAVLPEIFRGRPVIEKLEPEEITVLSALCPLKAIDARTGNLDLGRCCFCKECEFASGGKIRFTNDHRIAVSRREDLLIKPGEERKLFVDRMAIRKEVSRIFRRALKLRQVSAAGDNSVEMELNASGNVNFDMGRFGIEFVASPRHADGIVITGPISENMAAALELTYYAVPEPRLVIVAGTDAISGGIFAGSPALNRSFFEKHHVDLYLPGNPAHPLTIINGLLDYTGR